MHVQLYIYILLLRYNFNRISHPVFCTYVYVYFDILYSINIRNLVILTHCDIYDTYAFIVIHQLSTSVLPEFLMTDIF